MGTMSKFIKKTKRFQEGKANPRATEANRVQSGLLLRDMLTVMQFRAQYFNRRTRRYVFSLWRRHARNLPGYSRTDGTQPRIAALDRYKGVKLEIDHPSMVARRLLIRMS